MASPAPQSEAHQMALANELTAPAIRAAIAALNLPPGSRGLDVPCGLGNHTLWLADAVGPAGRVDGVDISEGFLAQGRRRAREVALADRVTFHRADHHDLPFDDDTFDWLWCVDGAYPSTSGGGGVTSDPVRLMREFARVVAPGGLVALAFWSGQKLLPGHPHLEARLGATGGLHFPFVEGADPQRHYARALEWLRAAGLGRLSSGTHTVTLQGPLDETTREALAMVFDMLWGRAEAEISSEDWQRFRALVDSDAGDCILDLTDYCGYIVYSVFAGVVG